MRRAGRNRTFRGHGAKTPPSAGRRARRSTQIAQALDRAHDRIVADREALLERQRALERHLAVAAHDMRTPLASLQLAVEEIAGEAACDTLKEPVPRALSDTVYLASLTENLHQGTRLREGLDPLDQRPRVDLVQVVEAVGLRIAALGRHRGIEVAVGVPDDALPATLRDLATRTLSTWKRGEGGGSRGLGVAISNEIFHRAGWQVRYERGAQGGLVVRITGPVAA